MKRYFIFQDNKSQKFWSIDTNGKSFTVTYGKLGSAGQMTNKEFDSEEACEKEAAKLTAEKVKKGYVESSEEGVSSSKNEGKKYYTDYDEEADLVEKILGDKRLPEIKYLTIGYWQSCGEGEDCQSIIDMFSDHKDKFSHITSLYMGDIESEENELSWICQGNYSKIWDALPNLETLIIKGSNGLVLGDVSHKKLKSLELISGGTDKQTFEELAKADLPNLEKLVVYVGVEDYGYSGDISVVKPLLNKNLFPKLTYLGIVDAEEQDKVVEMVLESDILKNLKVWDTSYGVLTDEGANKIIENADKVKHLEKIIIEWHFISPETEKKLKKLPCKVLLSDSQFDEDEDYRYPMYTE